MQRRRLGRVATSLGLLAVAAVLVVVLLPGSLPPATDGPSPSPPEGFLRNPSGPDPADPESLDRLVAHVRMLPTFAGVWRDPNQVDFHIALAGDIEDAIEAIGELVPRNTIVWFHVVEFSESELRAARDRIIADIEALRGEGITVSFVGLGGIANTVEVGIDPHTPQLVADLKQRYGVFVDFVHSPVAPPILNTPWPAEPEVLQAVVADASDDPLLTCGGTTFPASGLDAPLGAERADGPEFDALRLSIETFAVATVPNATWRLVGIDSATATFLTESEWGLWSLNIKREGDRWVPWNGGECMLRVMLSTDLPSGEWVLDQPLPDPAATELRILVHEHACSSGQPTSGRMSTPIAIYADDTLTITIGVQGVQGLNTCPGTPGTPVLLLLPEPVGDRLLLDGGRYPAVPAEQDYQSR